MATRKPKQEAQQQEDSTKSPVLKGHFKETYDAICAKQDENSRERLQRFIAYMQEIPKDELFEAIAYINSQLASHITEKGFTTFYKVPITVMIQSLTDLHERIEKADAANK